MYSNSTTVRRAEAKQFSLASLFTYTTVACVHLAFVGGAFGVNVQRLCIFWTVMAVLLFVIAMAFVNALSALYRILLWIIEGL